MGIVRLFKPNTIGALTFDPLNIYMVCKKLEEELAMKERKKYRLSTNEIIKGIKLYFTDAWSKYIFEYLIKLEILYILDQKDKTIYYILNNDWSDILDQLFSHIKYLNDKNLNYDPLSVNSSAVLFSSLNNFYKSYNRSGHEINLIDQYCNQESEKKLDDLNSDLKGFIEGFLSSFAELAKLDLYTCKINAIGNRSDQLQVTIEIKSSHRVSRCSFNKRVASLDSISKLDTFCKSMCSSYVQQLINLLNNGVRGEVIVYDGTNDFLPKCKNKFFLKMNFTLIGGSA